MLVAINLNNSNTSLALFEKSEIQNSYKIPTHKDFSNERYLQFLHEECIKHTVEKNVDGVIIGSVVPSLDDVFRQFIKIYFAKDPLFVTTDLKTGLVFRSDVPRELGSDRLANLVAANTTYQRPSIIVDAGTAITFDALSKRSEFLGGAIVPGVGISYQALIDNAELLEEIPLVAPAQAIGTNTTDNIQSGIVFGFTSLIDGMIGRMAHEMGVRKPYVIGTGGSMNLLAPRTLMIDIVDPDLTLKGLASLWELNH